ncbi:MAG: ABC transporter ATP-binding protein [Sphingobacteriales bacterium]|nr:MAG: ABC transporter ATP-binding protein [Sphingobacteriales bacterium]
MALLHVEQVSKWEGEKQVVNNLSFSQEALQKIAIAGETGSGKTSLLKMIAGFTEPASGKIFFNGEKVLGPNEQLIAGHKGIAYLSQYFELRNNYYVYELLEMANQLTVDDARKIFTVCQVEHLLHRRTNQLSGGEKQRIALARLLITSPKLLLLDEPFSNLDAIHKSTIKKVIHDIGDQLGITCMLVSHDPSDTLPWADNIMVMKEGAIVQMDTPQNIYHKPANEYCAGLFGEYNLIDIENKKFFIRPEHLIISTQPVSASFQAAVQSVSFMGSYYLIQLITNNQLFIATVNQGDLTPGSTVFISFKKENFWSFTS